MVLYENFNCSLITFTDLWCAKSQFFKFLLFLHLAEQDHRVYLDTQNLSNMEVLVLTC